MTEMNCEFKICEEINDEPVIVSTNTKTRLRLAVAMQRKHSVCR